MTIVVRIVQGLLILTGLAACVIAAVMAGMTHDDADARCYMTEVQDGTGGYSDVPSPGCGTMAVYQTEAISAAAVGLSGIGIMVGAAAMNGMASPRPKQVAQPAPYGGYGPPTGPQPYPQGPYGPPNA
ncbi:hypothetical protein [Actinokineospora sp. UTMC 2448]|uniref:hypothetical protein n=1 Tax=Actinokineospora sp. UTMC 2448 TaxID=2268449 RepID=UPI0021641745|nr:hypothetical protein [Actinokineospora sp. UTMC 2448]UVS76656.1 hypothetical protein Actkin_00350 [Actinokineospora sp. UTMC 2448]